MRHFRSIDAIVGFRADGSTRAWFGKATDAGISACP